MKLLQQLRGCRCVIGEGPIWHTQNRSLYYTNGGGKSICIWHAPTDTLTIRHLSRDVAAMAFTLRGDMIVSRMDGVFLLRDDDTTLPLYDTERYTIRYGNDMKVGPDGAIYVGTQSERRMGLSDRIDGKLYRIGVDGTVAVLLDGLRLSNGMAWSPDGTWFYHTDSDTGIIREYAFANGEISATGRSVAVPGVDGFTIDKAGRLYIGCWGQGHIAVVDTVTMAVTKTIPMPCGIPASCGFCGTHMDILAVTTACLDRDLEQDPDAGFTCLYQTNTTAPLPYLFGCRMLGIENVQGEDI